MANLPTSANCGDLIEWTDSFESGSTGYGILRHVESGTVIRIDPTISGTSWTLNIASEKTASAPSGLYSVGVIVTLNSERLTHDRGTITLAAPLDRPMEQTHARKMVALLERHLEGRIDDAEGRGLESYTVNGIPITKLSHLDARSMLDKYRRDVANENIANRARLGLGTGRRIQTYFDL
jgi:hypothetical protein